MKKIIYCSLFVSLFLIGSVKTYAQTFKIYTGLLHAHTSFSDGSGTPEEAYKMAKKSGMHFFAVTEHNHDKAESGAKERTDGILIATNNELYNGTKNISITTKAGEKKTVKSVITSAKAASTSTFLALYGQEFSTISSGNHMNIIGIDNVLTAENGNFKELADLLDKLKKEGKQVPVLQLNHPDVYQDLKKTSKNCLNDYGIDEDDLGPDFKNLVERLDPYVSLLEVLTGPAMSKTANPGYKYPSGNVHENEYYFYLKQGFHISPSVGQDNHYKTWGTSSDARTGVLATALNEKELYAAMAANRTFASEDKNLNAYLKVNGQVMGSSLTVKENDQLKMEVVIEDKDEAKTGYVVSVYGGAVEPELSTKATPWKAADGLLGTYEVTGNGTFSIDDIVLPEYPAFVYIKLEQNDGSRLWTAPVWLNEKTTATVATTPTTTPATSDSKDLFYWSSSASSKVYHKSGCSSINTIKATNLVDGKTPPTGRTLHGCKVSGGEEEGH